MTVCCRSAKPSTSAIPPKRIKRHMETILEKYGWVAMAVYVIMKDVLPWVMNRYFPAHMKKEQDKRNAEALLLKSELEDKEHRRAMEERSTVAMEKMGEAVIILNERLDKLTDITAEHNTFTIQAVTAMRETVAKRHITQDKIKPVRKAK